MKNLILPVIISLMTLSTVFAQKKATYDDVLKEKIIGQIDTYITKRGEAFSVGDTLTIGLSFRNDHFDHMYLIQGLTLNSLSNKASGGTVIIKKILVRNQTTIFSATSPQGYRGILRIKNLDGAIEKGEIKSSIPTSDEALEELKRWKSKLDLELITQEEYEAKKEELSNYID